MNLYRWLSTPAEKRNLSLNDLLSSFQYGGLNYGLQMGGTPGQNTETISTSFTGYTQGAYQSDAVVFACMAARQLLFSEARFQFRRMTNGRPGDLFGTPALGPLEVPWPNGTTGNLLTRAIVDVDLAGNFYAVRRGPAIRALRPDWVTIILGSRTGQEIDTEVVGYLYEEGGPQAGKDPVLLQPDVVCHWAPYPDPLSKFRGMSWLSPILDDILGDKSATVHKRQFFDHGAQLGYVVTWPADAKMSDEEYERNRRMFKAGHEGAENAYRTLFLTRGADIKTVGTDLKQVDFKQVQGAGETRICAAARVPPIIVGLSEGLDSATYSNYSQARRAFADLTMRPLWRGIAGALATITDVPGNTELWYDDRDIPFLQEDQKDEAEIQAAQAQTIAALTREGFTWASAVAAVTNGDMTMLDHTGLFSVQLQAPGTMAPAPSVSNGNGQPQLPAPTP